MASSARELRRRPHERDLGARPVEDLRSHRMPFARIAVEQTSGRVATDGGGKLPSKVHRVAKPEVESLAAQGGMDVRGVAGEQHPPFAVSRRLIGAIRPGGGKLERRQGDVGAGDAAQHRLHVLQRDRLDSVEGAAVELDHRDRPGPRVGVHARRRVVAARTELIRISHFDFDGIAGELGIGADELKAATLRTVLRPPSQPTSQRPRKVSPPARTVTPSSDGSKPSTPTPRRISTPIALARAARTDSMCSMSVAMLVAAGPGRRYGHFEVSMLS